MLSFLAVTAWSQCEPQECPDPEGNGEVCPDSLPTGYLNQLYSQVATIVVPEQDTNGVDLHHLELVSVDSLPPGIGWISNDPENFFLADSSYCILMDGTPTDTGTYYLRIVVDIYVSILGFPVFAGQVTDSSSLSVTIIDNTGIEEDMLTTIGNYPNPFSDWTGIRYEIKQPGEVTFEVYSLLGEKIHELRASARRGSNTILFNGEDLSPGLYIYVIRSGGQRITKRMIRTN
jgi:hypothetical protein